MDNNRIALFFDHLIVKHGLKNNAGLARACHVAPPVISMVRTGGTAFGAALMLRMHDGLGTPIKEMRAVAARVDGMAQQ